jgi:hypothetical protein
MRALIWIGAALTLLGVAALVWCILLAVKARKNARDDADLRARLQRVVALNMGALGISGLGLMCVVTGIFLS